jgi:hypothetical protein
MPRTDGYRSSGRSADELRPPRTGPAPGSSLDGVIVCGRGRPVQLSDRDRAYIAAVRRELVLLDVMGDYRSQPQPTAEQLLAALGLS